MHFRKKPGFRMKGPWLKKILWANVILFIAAVITGGCSEEEQPPPEGKNKIVVAIVQPEPEPVEALQVEKTADKEKAEFQEVATVQEETGKITQPEKPTPKTEVAGEAETIVPSSQGVTKTASSPEAKEPAPSLEVKETDSPPEMKEPASSATEEEPSASSEAVPTRLAGSTPTLTTSREKEVQVLEEGFARVGVGESLSAFAAREDTCGDALKWTRIYRLNPQLLAVLRTWKDIKEKPLQTGLALRYLSPEDDKASQSAARAKPWVVTVRSSQSPGRLAPQAIKLIDAGFNVYIARAEVKGKQWLRLRVGFYPGKTQAQEARTKIREILENNDSWLARAAKGELEEFGR